MKELETDGRTMAKFRNMLRMHHLKDFDPDLKFTVESIGAPDEAHINSIVRRLYMDRKKIYFSAITPKRHHVAQFVMEGGFPAGEFCSTSPKVVMQFMRGPELPVHVGTEGSICILVDEHASSDANSPSVVKLGEGKDADRLKSYRRTSSSVELLAVMNVKLTSVGNVSESGAKRKKKKHKGQEEIGDEVKNDRLKRALKKISDKRMDNFGIKEDF